MNIDLHNTIYEDIYKNGKTSGELYYGIYANKCLNLEYFFEKYSITKPEDKIHLAQTWVNYDIEKEEFVKLNLNLYEKEKLKRIRQNNQEWYETLNVELLKPKYAFLDNILDYIVTDIRAQELILSLNEEALNIFEKIFERLEKDTSNPVIYAYRALGLIGNSVVGSAKSIMHYQRNSMLPKRVEEFQAIANELNDKVLSDDLVELLLFIYTNNHWETSFDNLEQLTNFEKEEKDFVKNNISDFKEKEKLNDDDMNDLKSLVLMKCFGVNIGYANNILEIFDLNDISVGDYNQEYLSMYNSMKNILEEDNPAKLFEENDCFVTMSETIKNEKWKIKRARNIDNRDTSLDDIDEELILQGEFITYEGALI